MDNVALITGEEKIDAAEGALLGLAVEAMPRISTSFLAVDEIQELPADLERGHVFTDRVLRRGRNEEALLSARRHPPIIERLLPGASIVTRPRLSQLEFWGNRRLTRQPRRTAIVTFSTNEVYAIAELITPPAWRCRRGAGLAVARAPATPRCAMFQYGDVDYLVATDAVGMGLNLDVDHVAFASDRKYDGYQFRRLNPSEFAQIAGRAGRATRDGTFGTPDAARRSSRNWSMRCRRSFVRERQSAAMAQFEAGFFLARRAAGVAARCRRPMTR